MTAAPDVTPATEPVINITRLFDAPLDRLGEYLKGKKS
jgi:hypothetical protein